jgi:hypothetical protein
MLLMLVLLKNSRRLALASKLNKEEVLEKLRSIFRLLLLLLPLAVFEEGVAVTPGGS